MHESETVHNIGQQEILSSSYVFLIISLKYDDTH